MPQKREILGAPSQRGKGEGTGEGRTLEEGPGGGATFGMLINKIINKNCFKKLEVLK